MHGRIFTLIDRELARIARIPKVQTCHYSPMTVARPLKLEVINLPFTAQSD